MLPGWTLPQLQPDHILYPLSITISKRRNKKFIRHKLSTRACPHAKAYHSCQKTHPSWFPTTVHTCIEYRKLHSLLPSVTPATGTKKGTFAHMPLPKVDELFALLKGAKYFTALDLHSSYCPIKLDKESIPKSAFATVFGKFEFF